MSTVPDRFVLDGSVTLAWLFHDEKAPYADAVISKLPGIEMVVPRLWHLEIANILLHGVRRGRCTEADVSTWVGYLGGLPIVVDAHTEAQAWGPIMDLARQYGLTSYDAAYLELALREKLPLATLDKQLVAAAPQAGVTLYAP